MNTIDKKEQFEQWLFDMSDTLEAFFERLEGHKDKLDYSIESLNTIEKLLLEQYTSIIEARKPEEAENLNQYAVYLGETMRKNWGGKWSIELREKYAYHGLPIITDYCTDPMPECPLALVTTTVHRKKGDFLISLIGNVKKKLKQTS